ncbi:MAG: hypothetical protein WD341_05765 [Tistlia sp.]|uniref:hypothetical protein n=1 Tax=Tistlia sp. TaxID=3057121 RepID=UPI0034A12263
MTASVLGWVRMVGFLPALLLGAALPAAPAGAVPATATPGIEIHLLPGSYVRVQEVAAEAEPFWIYAMLSNMTDRAVVVRGLSCERLADTVQAAAGAPAAARPAAVPPAAVALAAEPALCSSTWSSGYQLRPWHRQVYRIDTNLTGFPIGTPRRRFATDVPIQLVGFLVTASRRSLEEAFALRLAIDTEELGTIVSAPYRLAPIQ